MSSGKNYWKIFHLLYYFQKVTGVKSVISGYMGGFIENPTYEIVCSGFSGHLETIEVEFDETIVSFEKVNIYQLYFIVTLNKKL